MDNTFRTVKDFKLYLEVMVVLLDCSEDIVVKLCHESEQGEYIRNTKILKRRYEYYIDKINKKKVQRKDIREIDEELMKLDYELFGVIY